MWVKLPTQTIKYIPKYGDILYSEYGAFEIDDGDATVFIKDDERFSVYRLIKGCLYPFIYTKTMAEYLKNSIKFTKKNMITLMKCNLYFFLWSIQVLQTPGHWIKTELL